MTAIPWQFAKLHQTYLNDNIISEGYASFNYAQSNRLPGLAFKFIKTHKIKAAFYLSPSSLKWEKLLIKEYTNPGFKFWDGYQIINDEIIENIDNLISDIGGNDAKFNTYVPIAKILNEYKNKQPLHFYSQNIEKNWVSLPDHPEEKSFTSIIDQPNSIYYQYILTLNISINIHQSHSIKLNISNGKIQNNIFDYIIPKNTFNSHGLIKNRFDTIKQITNAIFPLQPKPNYLTPPNCDDHYYNHY